MRCSLVYSDGLKKGMNCLPRNYLILSSSDKKCEHLVEKAESLQDGTAASSELALFLSLQQAFLSSLSGSADKGDVNRKFGAAKHLSEKIAKTWSQKE